MLTNLLNDLKAINTVFNRDVDNWWLKEFEACQERFFKYSDGEAAAADFDHRDFSHGLDSNFALEREFLIEEEKRLLKEFVVLRWDAELRTGSEKEIWNKIDFESW
jgi:hypothetical protein